MSPENTQRLYRRFPHLYRLGIEEKGCMHWGICTGDGWFDLLYRLSLEITEECARLGLMPGAPGYPVVAQVKEKFGALRFYLHPTKPESIEFSQDEILSIIKGEGAGHDKMLKMEADDAQVVPVPESVYALVRDAMKLSESTCERCGEPGTLRHGNWVHVHCDHCEAESKRGVW